MPKPHKPTNRFSRLRKEHKAFFSQADASGYLSTGTTDGLLVEHAKNFLRSILKDRRPLHESLDGVERLLSVSLLHAEYCLVVADDETKARESLQKAYGYCLLGVHMMRSCDAASLSKQPMPQEQIGYCLSLDVLLNGSTERHPSVPFLETKEPSSNLQAPLVFVLKLLGEAAEFGDGIGYPYQKLLETTESQSDDRVDYSVSLLCETHVALSEEGAFFGHPLVALFPYEALVWLKAREKAGLNNPKRYTHPMMNMPLVKMFMAMDVPLAKPKTLPLAQNLLETLKEQCPNVEIPAWLEESEDEPPKGSEGTFHAQGTLAMKEMDENPLIIRSNQIVPQSGTYQAFLPREHPLAQKVHQMPRSQQLGVEGVSLLPLGLNPEDEEQLRWEWIRE